MNRLQKQEAVEKLRATIGAAPFVILTDYKGLKVEQLTELRSELRKEKVSYKIAKNTMARLAFEGTDKAVLNDHLVGPIGIAYGGAETSATAKVLLDFQKKFKALELRAGYINGKPLNVAQIDVIGKLPDKDTLRAKLLSAFNGVPQKFVGLLVAAPRNFIGVLAARKDELEKAVAQTHTT